MQKTFIGLIGWLLLSFTSESLQAQPATFVSSKLPQGRYIKKDFTIVQGDTIFKKYEKIAFDYTGNDTILFVETYNVKSDWTLSRYIEREGEEEQAGWQEKYDLQGKITYAMFCDTATGDCNVHMQYSYYPNGNLIAQVRYYKHKMDGNSLFYYNDGTFRYHLEYREGLLWNALATYDQQGNITDPGDFCDGNGTLNIYAANGVLLKQRIYVDGKVKRTINIAK
ncbi:MAG TPA: hypothetical protein PLM27_15220 [Chitinophagales bacterium]|nr:hypothetical protein [Chitinophagales bacterium]